MPDRLLFVTQVAPYRDGPAGVHGVLDQAAVGVAQVAELHGLDSAARRRRPHARRDRVARRRGRSRCSRSARRRGARSSRPRSSTASAPVTWRSLSIHSATDSCYGWDEYGALVGARFDGHPWTQTFTADVLEPGTSRVRAPRRRVAVARRGVPVPRSATRRAGPAARARRRARSRRARRASAVVRLPARVVLHRGRRPRVLDQPRPLPARVGDRPRTCNTSRRPRLGAGRRRVSTNDRLDELGLVLPGPYPPHDPLDAVIVHRGRARTSGQLPRDHDGALVNPGTLGLDLTVEQGAEAARWCALNALSVLRAELGGLDRDRTRAHGARVRRLRQGFTNRRRSSTARAACSPTSSATPVATAAPPSVWPRSRAAARSRSRWKSRSPTPTDGERGHG